MDFLLSENKFSKYLLYVIGEIALVMFGILLALRVNNGNESRKERVQEIKHYEKLLVSLTADSADVLLFSGLISAAMETQNYMTDDTNAICILTQVLM